MADLSGMSIDRYQIIERLGQGGMATAYRAYDTRFEREVAIKAIRRGAFSEEHLASIINRFAQR